MAVSHRKQEKRTRGTRVAVWILSVVLILSVICVGAVGFVYMRLNGMQFSQKDIDLLIQPDEDTQTEEIIEPDDPEVLEGLAELNDNDFTLESVEKVTSDTSIKNYMLFGVDSRKEDDFRGLSDVMMMVTVDTKNNSIKLTSFMRDILLPIKGYGNNRLNIVYKFKGPEEACKSIESISGVPIDGYGIMNFYTVAQVVDIFGGVDIENLTSAEKDNLNKSVREMNQYTSKPSEEVKSTGPVHLNGLQAVAYMRIRKVGGDTQRTERQRTVISALFKGLKNLDLADIIALADKVVPCVKTNLTAAQIASLAKDVFVLRGCDIEQMRVPIDGAYTNASYNKMSILKIDTAKNAEAVKKFIYGE